MRVFDDVNKAYRGMLHDVYYKPDYLCSPRGMNIREILDYQLKIENPSSDPIVTKDVERNSIIKSYTEKELEWYLSGSVDVEDAKKISKFWGKLANPDNTVNSNYGYLIFHDRSEGDPNMNDALYQTPFDWARSCLLSDKDSRQALIRFNKPKHAFYGNKDFVCTLSGIFMIRDNKLNLSMVQRSGDLFTGLVYDIPFFCFVQKKMLDEIRMKYPEVSMGSYTHMIHSLHIYEKNSEAILKMIGEKE